MKKGIKKYQDATNSLELGNTYSNTGGWNYGFGVNPENASLQQYTTTSPSTIPTGSLPLSGSIADLNKPAAKKLSFKDKAGSFMGKYGGPISAVAGTIAPLLMKKPDPNEKPYKKGTKNLNTNMKNKKSLIKYQDGVEEMSLKEQETTFPEDLVSNKDKLVAKLLPKFLRNILAKKSTLRYKNFQEELENAKKEAGITSPKLKRLTVLERTKLGKIIKQNRNLEKERAEKEEEYNRELETEKIRKKAEKSEEAYDKSQRELADTSIPYTGVGPSNEELYEGRKREEETARIREKAAKAEEEWDKLIKIREKAEKSEAAWDKKQKETPAASSSSSSSAPVVKNDEKPNKKPKNGSANIKYKGSSGGGGNVVTKKDSNQTAQQQVPVQQAPVTKPKVTPSPNANYKFGEKPMNIFGTRFTIRPSTIEKALGRATSVGTAFGKGPLVVPALIGAGSASLVDFVNEFTPKGSDAEKYLSTASKTLDYGTGALGAIGSLYGTGSLIKGAYKMAKNPKAALQTAKDIWNKRIQMTGKPLPQMGKIPKNPKAPKASYANSFPPQSGKLVNPPPQINPTTYNPATGTRTPGGLVPKMGNRSAPTTNPKLTNPSKANPNNLLSNRVVKPKPSFLQKVANLPSSLLNSGAVLSGLGVGSIPGLININNNKNKKSNK